MRLLLGWGADVNAQGGREVSSLFKAIEGRHEGVAFELLHHGADPNWCRPRDGISGLFIACLHALNLVVEALLNAGANPNAQNNEGQPPLLYIVAQKPVWGYRRAWAYKILGNYRTFEILVKYGADIEARDHVGKTALLKAASNNHQEAVEALLDGGLGRKADISARNSRGLTALYLAAEKNHIDIVSILFKHGANPRVVSDGGWTPLHPAARWGYTDVLRTLLKAGAAVNAQLSNGMTPLQWAAMNGHEDIVKILLAEPDINLTLKIVSTGRRCFAPHRKITWPLLSFYLLSGPLTSFQPQHWQHVRGLKP